MERFRRDRIRNKKFSYGDQWSDLISVEGRTMTEGEYLAEAGAYPLKNNLIRRLVRNVIGVYASQANEPRCVARDPDERSLASTMTSLLRYNGELNRMSALMTRTLEEFMISGIAVHRKWYGKRNGRVDCWTDYVSPASFFVDSDMRDFRGWDCKCAGQIHDVDFADLCGMFAFGPEGYAALKDVYGEAAAKCRVIEVWRKEHRCHYLCHDRADGSMRIVGADEYLRKVVAENRRRERAGEPGVVARWVDEEVWRYYFISPQGHVLASGDSPYAHGSHPYVIKAYPLIDGEVHSFVGDVIDQQKYTNRLVTTYDWIIRSSAKGVLLMPEDCIPYGDTADRMAKAWSRSNGLIVYKNAMNGSKPHQAASTEAHSGITDLLNLQMGLFEDISGVHGALEGKLSSGSVSAALYGQQTQAATMALQDLLGAFAEFARDGAYIDVCNMQQFYSAARIRSIVGAGVDMGVDDTEKMRAAEFDLSIAPNTDTPATRQANNQLLMEIWKSGQITLGQMLRAGDFSFAPELLSELG